jgi:hypothetical protein
LFRHMRSKHSDSERPLDGKANQPECIEWMRARYVKRICIVGDSSST